ncbi:hypothetical protein SK128_023527 [Halocaridina rubra]|uniref:Uncharacterized protein n=1 Tax=Halocaridina rubra TaxID=373956 RepID=A0AAN8WK92_HALRR
MMNIQVNASLQAINKGGGPPDSGSAQVVVLQPAAVDETTSLQPQTETPKQRRRPKLSEEAQAERRVKIASRMREKRATENDEQKRLRRIREAERMRRKRATENDEVKFKRRMEAAARARNRRASMSPEERVIDRQKAAARMRLRRATESSEAKALRRMKAAERMRKRRANETPEQRAERRQNIALRMKARRKRKLDLDMNGDDANVNNMDCRIVKCENARSGTPLSEVGDSVTNISGGQTSHTMSAAHLVQQAPHLAIPSSVGVGGGLALLHVDPNMPSVGLTAAPVLSTMDVTQLNQPLSLHKSVPEPQNQVSEPLPLQKHIVVSHESSVTSTAASTQLPSVSSIAQSSMEPIPLHKTSSHPHHLPHLLHYQHASTTQPIHQQSVHQHHSMASRHQQQ